MIVGIIGLGWVGTSVAINVLHRGIARRLLLHDVRDDLATAEAADLSHGAPFYPSCEVATASVEQMARECDAVVIAAGSGAMHGASRLDSLEGTASIVSELGRRLRDARGIVVTVTNPVDIATRLIVESSGLPAERVVGTGTMLDTARLRSELSDVLNVDERHIHANVLGEHGDSQVVAWSSATVAGVPVSQLGDLDNGRRVAIAESVRTAAYMIIAGKGATNHAIGLVTATLLAGMLRDERRVFTVSRMQTSPAWETAIGTGPVALSLPYVLDRSGAVRVLPPALDDTELRSLRASADTLRDAYASLPDPGR